MHLEFSLPVRQFNIFSVFVTLTFFSYQSFSQSNFPPDPGQPTINGITYYVDATSGVDTNQGTSESSAWKTLAKVSNAQLLPGDAVLFKRGETWIGSLQLKYSGTAQKPIIYGAYGTGDRPKISALKNRDLEWTAEGNNIWRCTNPPSEAPRRLYRNGKEIMIAVHNDDPAKNEELGDMVPDLISWSWDGDLRVYGDPSQDSFAYSDQYAFMADSKSHIILYGLNLEGGTEASFLGYNLSHITFRYVALGAKAYQGVRIRCTGSICENLVFEYSLIEPEWVLNYYDAGIGSFSWRGAREGIYVSNKTKDLIVRHCLFTNWHHSSLNLWTTINDTPHIQDGTKVLYNVFTSPNIPYGGRIAMHGLHRNYEIAYNHLKKQTGSRMQIEGQNGHVHHNIFEDMQDSKIDNPGAEGMAIRLGDWYGPTDNILIENNDFYDCKPGGIDVGGTGGRAKGRGLQNVTIQNNIFVECHDTSIVRGVPIAVRNADYPDYTSKLTIKNNLAYSSISTMFGVFIGGQENISDFESNANANGSIASDNINADPLFSDSLFHLENNSPALGAGIKPNSTLDYDGVTIMAPYAIGIYNNAGVSSSTNKAPIVEAGADQAYSFPTEITLEGEASDDGLPDPPKRLAIEWTKVSGPGNIIFNDASALNSNVNVDQAGIYILQLSAYDGEFTSTDEVTLSLCDSSQTICSQSCVDLNSDPNHCGACDNACPQRDHASPICESKICSYRCNEGWSDCDHNPDNGCEIESANCQSEDTHSLSGSGCNLSNQQSTLPLYIVSLLLFLFMRRKHHKL